jgi:hypothetical protein
MKIHLKNRSQSSNLSAKDLIFKTLKLMNK